MLVLELSLLLDLTICMSVTLEGVMGEIASYHEKDYPFPFLGFASYASFGLSLAFPFCLPCDGSGHQSFIILLCI